MKVFQFKVLEFYLFFKPPSFFEKLACLYVKQKYDITGVTKYNLLV